LIPADLSSEEVRANKKYLGIILNLRNCVETEQEGYSNIINIIVTSGDPKFAQRLANTIARVYKEERVLDLNKRTIEAKKFIENQLKIVKQRLRNSEEAVRNFREKNKLISLSAQTSGMLGQAARLQAAYDKAKADRQKIIDADRMLERAKDKPLTSKTSFYIDEASTLYKGLNNRLVQLMLERDTLLLTYTKNYPQVVEINGQVREIVSNMKAQLSSQEKVLAENIRTLKKKIDKADEQIKMLPEKGLDLARLERNVRVNMEVYTLLEKKYQESLIKEAEKIEEVKIVKPALEPANPINPPKTLATTVVGTIIGLILGIVFAFIIETFDTSIAAIEDIEELLGVSVLGIIPYVSVQEIKATLEEKYPEGVDEGIADRHARLVSHFAPESILAESFRALRTNLSFISLEKDIKTVVFTSSSPREGKTISVINLAITMAQAGNRVLLVEADLRKPVISRMFGIHQVPGLTDAILGDYEWRNVVRTITDVMMGKMSMDDIMKTPGIDNLHIVPSGTIPPNPAELVNSKSISEFIKEAGSEYDMVLMDAPPVLAATDAAILGSRADGVILVYQVGKISRGALKRAKAQLDNVKANVIGIVLNGLRAEISPDFSGYDYYKQYYTYGQKEEERKTFWSRLLSIPGLVAGLFRRVSEKRPEKEQEDKGRSKLKIVVLLIAILFLIIGILFQADYLRLPGCIVSLFRSTCALHADRSQPRDIPVEDNAAKVKIFIKKIEKNLSMVPSGETEPKDQKAEKPAANKKPYAIQIISYREKIYGSS
jgi:capsular exopolysaccharide synthesis family protein